MCWSAVSLLGNHLSNNVCTNYFNTKVFVPMGVWLSWMYKDAYAYLRVRRARVNNTAWFNHWCGVFPPCWELSGEKGGRFKQTPWQLLSCCTYHPPWGDCQARSTSHGCLTCKELLCGWGSDSQSRAQQEHQVEAREDLCSDSAPSIVVDTIRVLVEQQRCL